MARKNRRVGGDVMEYVRRRSARDPEFAAVFEAEFDKLQLARQIRAARMARGLTQHELAERVGTKQPSIARLERGKAIPRLDVLTRIAVAIGMTLEIRLVPTPREA